MPTEQEVMTALSEVIDPELGSNLVELGLVRNVRVHDGLVEVELVLTVPGCPLAGWIVEQIRQVVGALPGVERVDVALLDEPWQLPDAYDWQEWVDRALGRRW